MTTRTRSATRAAPLDAAVMQCPFGYYAERHQEGAPAFDEGAVGWVVPGYAELVEMTRDPAHFSSTFHGDEGPQMRGISPEHSSPEVEELFAGMHPMANALFMADPPTHTRQRVLATKALNAGRIRALEPRVHEVVDELVDAFVDDGRCEFLDQFAIWLPVTMISELLGIDRADMPLFKRWSDDIAQGLVEALDNEGRLRVGRSVIEYQDYLLERIAQRRAAPTDDLLGAIVAAELDLEDLQGEDGEQLKGPRHLTDPEILAIVSQLLTAGNHTTTDLRVNAMVLLLQHPEAMAELRADQALIPNMIEEAMRLDAPVRCTYRRTPAEATLKGMKVPANTMLAANWGGAGHDPAVFPDPDRFDIHRANAKKHLSFGHGPHFCVGSGLARTEARIAFETLLTRLDDIRLAEGTQLTRHPQFSFASYTEIPITFTTAGHAL